MPGPIADFKIAVLNHNLLSATRYVFCSVRVNLTYQAPISTSEMGIEDPICGNPHGPQPIEIYLQAHNHFKAAELPVAGALK